MVGGSIAYVQHSLTIVNCIFEITRVVYTRLSKVQKRMQRTRLGTHGGGALFFALYYSTVAPQSESIFAWVAHKTCTGILFSRGFILQSLSQIPTFAGLKKPISFYPKSFLVISYVP